MAEYKATETVNGNYEMNNAYDGAWANGGRGRGRGRGGRGGRGRGGRGRGLRGGRGRGMGRGRGGGGRGAGHRVMALNQGLNNYDPYAFLEPRRTNRKLTDKEKETFRTKGCVVIKNGVPAQWIAAAKRKINHAIGKGIHLENVAPQTGLALFNNDFIKTKEMIHLVTQSDAYSLCEDLLGVNNVVIKNGRSQIALRFPETPEIVPDNVADLKEDEQNWHIDGLQNHTLPQFNILVGIALSTQLQPFCGQFTFWPGTHYEIQKVLAATGYEAFWQKYHLPNQRTKWNDTIPYEQCNVDVGDIVLVHPFVAHKGGINYSADTRYNMYYRIQHKDFEQIMTDEKRIKDLWIGMDGMKK